MATPTPALVMSKRAKRPTRHERSDAARSNEVHLPGTVGATDPDRAVTLMQKWADEGNVEEDRRACEAVLEEVERARS